MLAAGNPMSSHFAISHTYLLNALASSEWFTLTSVLVRVTEAVVDIDKPLGYLLDRLTQNDLLGMVNMVLFSDHEVTETTWDQIIVLNGMFDPFW